MGERPADLSALLGDAARSVAGAVGNAMAAATSAGARVVAGALGVLSPWSRSRRGPREPHEGARLRALRGGGDDRTQRPASRARPSARDDRGAAPPSAEEELSFDDATFTRDRLVLLPRDPRVVFAYWELTDDTRARIAALAASADASSEPRRAVLRAAAGHEGASRFDSLADAWTITLAPLASSAYVDLGEARARVEIELGLLGDEGSFESLARAEVEMPAARPAPLMPPRWRRVGRSTQEIEPEELPELPAADVSDALFRRAAESEHVSSDTLLGDVPR